MDRAQVLCELTKAHFGHLVTGLPELKCNELPTQVAQYLQDYVLENPTTSIVDFASLLIMIFPGLVAGPFFAVVGFSGIGPVAASWAAAYQSVHGATAAFRIFQSAAMGGWGRPIVAGVIRGGAALAGGIANWFRSNGTTA